jgi:glutamate/tyrosine decarboxylase-like PLP-dependent enzyme
MADAHDILQAAARIAAGHLDGITDRPVWRPVPEELQAGLTGQTLPERGLDPERLLAVLEQDVLAYPMGNGHPAFFGWVNAAPHPAGIAAALLAAAMNPSSAGGDHADVYLERAAVRWIAELIGYPHEPGAGLLTSGASMATIVAVGAARQRALAGIGWDVRERGLSGAARLVAYGSEEVHSCVRKAVELLGIGSANLRAMPVDASGHLEPTALREAVRADRAAGAVPFLVAGSAGTVSTGAVDPLGDLAAVCAEEGLWFHVDGAYGGLGVLDPLIAPRYAGMERADSVALDPHKWLQVPAGVGCLLVRDRRQLRDAFSYVPAYLRDDSAGQLGWYSEYGIEQTRPPRSLPVWAAIAARGREGVAADITACTSTARLLGGLVERDPDFELAAPVETSIVAFRYAPAGISPDEADRLTREAAGAVQAGGRAFVTDSVFRGRPILRACLINPATGAEDVSLLLDQVREAASGRRG